MADNTIAENRDEGSFIWDNYYDADEKINEYDLTLFIKEQSEDEDDIYKKFEETHFQRCYEISELKELLEQSGLVFDAVYDAYTEKYGVIGSNANKRAFSDDSSYCLLCSLEDLNEDGTLKRKADMFTKRTIKKAVAVTSVETATEALAISLNEKARVDLS